jgi:hypothetical protein
LFDLEQPRNFHAALARSLENPQEAKEMAGRGALVTERYSVVALAGRLKELYQELIEEKRCIT